MTAAAGLTGGSISPPSPEPRSGCRRQAAEQQNPEMRKSAEVSAGANTRETVICESPELRKLENQKFRMNVGAVWPPAGVGRLWRTLIRRRSLSRRWLMFSDEFRHVQLPPDQASPASALRLPFTPRSQPGINVSHAARRYGSLPHHLPDWRRYVRQGLLNARAPARNESNCATSGICRTAGRCAYSLRAWRLAIQEGSTRSRAVSADPFGTLLMARRRRLSSAAKAL